MNGQFIRLVVSPKQIEELRKAEFIELRLVSATGDVGDKVYFYKKDLK